MREEVGSRGLCASQGSLMSYDWWIHIGLVFVGFTVRPLSFGHFVTSFYADFIISLMFCKHFQDNRVTTSSADAETLILFEVRVLSKLSRLRIHTSGDSALHCGVALETDRKSSGSDGHYLSVDFNWFIHSVSTPKFNSQAIESLWYRGMRL